MSCFCFFVLSVVLAIAGASRSDDTQEPDSTWQAGVASAAITPDQPLRISGYATRKKLAEGTEQELYAKVLAVEDGDGHRVVILTMDLMT